jgi:hypothetical protein
VNHGSSGQKYRNKIVVLAVSNNRGWVMKTLKVSLIASLIGTAVGLGAWILGLGRLMWPAHPEIASFLLTLITTIVVQILWPRLTETYSQ